MIALKRIASMLKQGGVFFLRDLIYSCDPDEIEQVLQNWLDNATDDPAAGWTRAELETHIREEYSPFSWLLDTMLDKAGFEIRKVEHTDSKLYSTYVCIKH